MSASDTPKWPTSHIITKLEAIGSIRGTIPAVAQACDEAAERLRELAATELLAEGLADALREISRDAWSGDKARMNHIGRTADEALSAWGKRGEGKP